MHAHNNNTELTIDTDLKLLDENDAFDQFPQPTSREQPSKFLENPEESNSNSISTEKERKIPEPLGSSSSLPHSPGLPSPVYDNESYKPNDDVESPTLSRKPSNDVESPT